MIALDSNLLVYAFQRHAPEHAAALEAVTAAQLDDRGCGVPLLAAAEFWAGATRTTKSTDSAKATEFLEVLQSNGVRMWLPRSGFGSRLFATAQERGITGNRIFDWQIGLTALEHGATELWTHDHAFRAPEALRIVDPLR